jgi:hypothetical protein
VFASHTRSDTCVRTPSSRVPAPRLVTRRSSCSADRKRPADSSPTGAGPSIGMASGSRFRASSAARSMPNPRIYRGDPGQSASTTAHTSSAARRKSRTTPATVSAVSVSMPGRAHSPSRCSDTHCNRARKEARRHEQRVPVEYLSSCDLQGIAKCAGGRVSERARPRLCMMAVRRRPLITSSLILVGRLRSLALKLAPRRGSAASREGGKHGDLCLGAVGRIGPEQARASATPPDLPAAQRWHEPTMSRRARMSWTGRAGASYSWVRRWRGRSRRVRCVLRPNLG